MRKKDLLMVGILILMLMELNWEWTNIKSFISGVVVGVWSMQTFYKY